MAKRPRKPEPIEDPEQSARFLQTVADLEAAGKLDRAVADAEFERRMKWVEEDAAARKKPKDS